MHPHPSKSILLAAAIFLPALAFAEPHELTLERDVRPILKEHCFHCHGEGEKLKGGVDLRLRRFMEKPTKDGDKVMVPGKPEESEMLQLVRDGDMPEKGKKLTPAEISTLEQWIAQGAKTLRPEPEQVPKVWITEEEREYWAFQPIRRGKVPQLKNAADVARVRTPIDAFLLAKLEQKGLTFSPEADKQTLLRRVTIDLTGLPPTPEEVATFLADDAPDAYERLVDRLLASPHYGERWGRHWLDIAGYADSDGYTDSDPARLWAYRYRDYVIRSINADKPIDEFIREQLAGDEMVKQPYKNLSPGDIDKLTATAFLRMVPDGTAAAATGEQTVARNAVVSETLKVVSSTLFGLTVGCAQCHDHKYDPIPQVDYYRLRAIFEPGFDLEHWRTPNARLISLMTDEERAKAAAVEKEAQVVETERKAKENEFIEKVLTWELEKKPEELREPLRTAYRTEAKKRTPEQLKLLKEHPTINQLSPGSLYLYDRTYGTKHQAELKVFSDKEAEIRKRKPAEIFIPAFTETATAAKTPPPTFVFSRGDPQQPKDKVEPSDLTVLTTFHPSNIPDSTPAQPTTGRRLAFAMSVTDGKHPLTTRVFVNRVWHHHFGRGIVASVGDFGHLGDKPTHPELLDWLASEFVAEHWSLKQLHRLIVTSTAYRQSSEHTAAQDHVDPDNYLLGRMNIQRIEAETLRDAMLAISGKLNPKMFGAPVPVKTDEDGQIVVGVDTTDTAGRPTGKYIPLNGDEFRRSVYIQMRRSKPLGMLETFDLPRMEPNCERRNASTIAPQSLAMMNGEFTLDEAKYFAERVTREVGADPTTEIKHAWLLAFGCAPTDAELKDSIAFLAKQTAHFKTDPVKPEAVAKGKEGPPTEPAMQALSSFCQALLTSNEFFYVD
ncbi:cytochrome c [Chthoniobacter flavus]|uniref:PSD1 and planctomycete cytochrome C domain-containing protein n=1 Tax=Chthoniobacter flavus TaxID=191863 RepID=UPI00104E06BE|nr:PSD1 and planctomycete cytochrome C domain-containing protein [Chthoniobacter flavus]TCO93620.1 cytochrome c [Chthoniobacter flavus]